MDYLYCPLQSNLHLFFTNEPYKTGFTKYVPFSPHFSWGVCRRVLAAILENTRLRNRCRTLVNNYTFISIYQPFGKRSGSKVRNWDLYPKALTEMARASRVGTGGACLLTHDKKCMIKVRSA